MRLSCLQDKKINKYLTLLLKHPVLSRLKVLNALTHWHLSAKQFKCPTEFRGTGPLILHNLVGYINLKSFPIGLGLLFRMFMHLLNQINAFVRIRYGNMKKNNVRIHTASITILKLVLCSCRSFAFCFQRFAQSILITMAFVKLCAQKFFKWINGNSKLI